MTHLVKTLTAQKMKKSLMENFIFCAVSKIGKKTYSLKIENMWEDRDNL